MSWLDDLLAQGIGQPPATAFPKLPHEQQFDPEYQAEEARQAAALQLARAGRRAPGEMSAQQPVLFPGIGTLNAPVPEAPAPAPTPEPVQPTNDYLASNPVPYRNGVPVPVPRPKTAPAPSSPMSLAPPEPDGGELPPNARTAVGMPPPNAPVVPPAAPVNNSAPGIGGILGKLFDPANAPLLMAMGGGFAGAPSFGTGMRRAFSEGAPQAALLRKDQITQEAQNATVKALRAKGIPEADIVAASQNPDFLKQVLAEHFGGWKPITVGEGPFGKNIVMSGPGGQVMPVDDYMRKFGLKAPPQVPGSTSAAPSDIPEGAIPVPQGTQSGILKPGLRYYNPNEADPQKYLDQFSPEMQSGMKNYLAGKSLPVSNPRTAGMAAEIRKYAPLYAEKAGIDHSEVAIKARSQMETDLAATTAPSKAGGQITFGGTTLTHLGEVAKNAVELKNASILGAAPLSETWNSIQNTLSEPKKANVRDFLAATGHYGQEVTKFYTGSPGGVEERLKFAANTSPSQAPAVLGGAIRGEMKLLPGRFEQIYENVEKQFGKERADKELARAHVPQRINEIKEQLAKLDPNGPEAQEKKLYGGKFAPVDVVGRPAPVQEPVAQPQVPAATAPATPRLAPGQTTTINGVTIKKLED